MWSVSPMTQPGEPGCSSLRGYTAASGSRGTRPFQSKLHPDKLFLSPLRPKLATSILSRCVSPWSLLPSLHSHQPGQMTTSLLFTPHHSAFAHTVPPAWDAHSTFMLLFPTSVRPSADPACFRMLSLIASSGTVLALGPPSVVSSPLLGSLPFSALFQGMI